MSLARHLRRRRTGGAACEGEGQRQTKINRRRPCDREAGFATDAGIGRCADDVPFSTATSANRFCVLLVTGAKAKPRIGLILRNESGDNAFMNMRASRTVPEAPRMAKINMPKDDILLPMGQKKPQLHRYWLQVDRQTKSSYEMLQEAETAGKAIKAAHPNLQVSIYDAEKSQQTLVAV
jgi:hypothetical protein